MSNKIIVTFDIVNENGKSVLSEHDINTISTPILTESPMLSNPIVFRMGLMRFIGHYAATSLLYLHEEPQNPDHRISKEQCNNIG